MDGKVGTVAAQGMAFLWITVAINLAVALWLGVPRGRRRPVAAAEVLFWGFRREGFAVRFLLGAASVVTVSAASAVSELGAVVVAHALLGLWGASRWSRTNGADRPEVLLRNILPRVRRPDGTPITRSAWGRLPEHLQEWIEQIVATPFLDWMGQRRPAHTREEVDEALKAAPPEVRRAVDLASHEARAHLVVFAASLSIRTAFGHEAREAIHDRLAVREEDRGQVKAAIRLLQDWELVTDLVLARVAYREVAV